jgi:hypothetical protein
MASKGQASTGQNGRTKSPKARGSDKDEAQRKRFIETARELGADETGHRFSEAVSRLLPPKDNDL